MAKNIVWSQDASDDLIDIVTYIKEKAGKTVAKKIFESIIGKVEKIEVLPEIGRIVPELQSVGIIDVREIIEKHWRVFYRVSGNEIQITSIIDGRRNVEELLYKKIIDGKI